MNKKEYTKEELLEILKEGVDHWNKWRENHPDIKINLSCIDFNEELEDSVLWDNQKRRLRLKDINLQKTDLEYVNLHNADLKNANLKNASLTGANLQNASLDDANLREAYLMNTNLQYANLNFANLQKACLNEANLQKASLMDAKLQNADLNNANLQVTLLEAANLQNAILDDTNLKKADLNNANLQNASLIEANLQEVDLSYANLTETDVSDVKFHKKKGKYIGIVVATCYGNQRFKRHAQDQDFLEEFKEEYKYLYFIWWLLADCGRTFWRWITWSVVLSIGFGLIYYYHLGGSSSFNISHLSNNLWTFIYYSLVTFTTLGLGDVVPTTTAASVFVVIEVILGYVMLGGLISLLANKVFRQGG